MSDATSRNRPLRPSPPAELVGPVSELSTGSSGRAPSADADQPTVISNRPPLSPGSNGLAGPSAELTHGLSWGDRLGHYELVGEAGGGGMGRVFRALDTRLARTVALKVLSPDQAADTEALQRFQNEAQAAARLDHTNIARVYFVGEDRGLHFIAFEFVEGTNVRDMVQRSGPLPLAEAVSFTLQVAEALVHAADRNVVHRDIKPSNIIVTPQHRAKLVDMGLARRQQPQQGSHVDLTASGVTLGTFDYISPEQARDPRNADVRSDIYSLGCTFFFMLTGRPPFPGGTVLQKLLMHQADEPPELRELRPDVPDAVSYVVRKMLAKDPRRRHQHPSELVEDLTSVARQLGLQATGADGQTWTVPVPRKPSFLARHIPWAVPVIALLATATSLKLLWSSSVPSEEVAPPPVQGTVLSTSPRSDEGGGTSDVGPSADVRPGTEPAVPPGPETGPLSPTGPSRADGSPAAEPLKVASRGTETAPLPEPFPDGIRTPGDSAAEAETPRPPSEAATKQDPSGTGSDPLAGNTAGTPGVKAPGTPEAGAPGTSSPGTAETTPGSVAADPPTRANGALIVDPVSQAADTFPTLGAACQAASSGDQVVLRYNGRVEQAPFELADVKLTVRAAEGYQPVVVFRTAPPAATETRSPAALTIHASQLRLIGVAVDLGPAAGPSDSPPALVSMQSGAALKLERCVLTALPANSESAAAPPVAILFRVTGASEPAAAGAARPTTEILLDDCIVRGETGVVRNESTEPLRLVWDNGLLATRGPLMEIEYSAQAGEAQGQVRVELSNLTAWIPGGLCRKTAPGAPTDQPLMQIACSDSILIGTSAAPLVEHVGVQGVSDLQDRFGWDGSGNFYEGWDTFWVIRSPGRGGTTTSMGREAWNTFWGPERESQPHFDAVLWDKRPSPDSPLYLLGPRDFVLSDTAENPALGAQRYGPDAGCQTDRLPPLPPPTPLTTPAPGSPNPEEPEPPPPPTLTTPHPND